jgi:hypothetical protein
MTVAFAVGDHLLEMSGILTHIISAVVRSEVNGIGRIAVR